MLLILCELTYVKAFSQFFDKNYYIKNSMRFQIIYLFLLLQTI